MLVQLSGNVVRVNQSNHRIQHQAFAQNLVHKKSLDDRPRIGQAGGLQNQPVNVQRSVIDFRQNIL